MTDAKRERPRERYRVIVADPPWAFDDKLTMSDVARGAEANYGTMSMGAIAGLPVMQWAEQDALIAVWCPSSLFLSGMQIVSGWGFEPKQIYTWVKTSKTGLAFGMGRYFRNCTEHAIVATRGKLSKLIVSKSERCASQSPALPHSQKPEDLQNALDRMLPSGLRLEMFARRSRYGWRCVGNECPDTPGQDIRTWQPPEVQP